MGGGAAAAPDQSQGQGGVFVARGALGLDSGRGRAVPSPHQGVTGGPSSRPPVGGLRGMPCPCLLLCVLGCTYFWLPGRGAL